MMLLATAHIIAAAQLLIAAPAVGGAACKDPYVACPHLGGPTCWPKARVNCTDAADCCAWPSWFYPGPAYTHPKVHNSPNCLHNHGWHDMAGALTIGGQHHVFQGCPDGPGAGAWGDHPADHDTGGWHHSVTTDHVHFTQVGIAPGLSALNETYEGIDAFETPCSGFVVHDAEARQVCAGFRECHGTRSWPGATRDGVPLQFRCTADAELARPAKPGAFADWSAPEYVDDIDPNFNHHEPYDPVRPWKDGDGQWYLGISLDACNSSRSDAPGISCRGGGRLAMWTSPALRGPAAKWRETAVSLFTANATKNGYSQRNGAVHDVFVTSDFIGGLRGDPAGAGATRCVLQNTPTAVFWCGLQKNGGTLQPYWDKPGAVGHYDYVSADMADTQPLVGDLLVRPRCRSMRTYA